MNFLSFFSLFIFSLSLWAQDPYGPHIILKEGKYKGQVADTSKKRALKIISENENEFIVANFRHQDHFWKAVVPKNGVEKLIVQVVKFKTGLPFITAAHTQLRVVMKDENPIKLTPQAIGHQGSYLLKDFVISVEALTPKDVKYNIVEGIAPNYAIVTRMISTESKADDDVGRVITQYPLNIYRSEANQYLSHAIYFGDKLDYGRCYNTLNFNCTTELFNLLDQSIDYHKEVSPFKISLGHILDPVAGATLNALKQRGLLTSIQYPSLSDELENILKDQTALNTTNVCEKVLLNL